jgi:hypothetical protein
VRETAIRQQARLWVAHFVGGTVGGALAALSVWLVLTPHSDLASRTFVAGSRCPTKADASAHAVDQNRVRGEVGRWPRIPERRD